MDGLLLLQIFKWILILLILYALYYLLFEVRKPRVHCNERKLSFLKKHVPILFRNFWPTFYFLDPRLQTIFRNAFIQNKDIKYKRELFELDDGEVVALDWSEKYYVKTLDKEDTTNQDRPIVIVLPGFQSHSRLPQLKRLIAQCDADGYRGVVMNDRGSAGMPLTRSKFSSIPDLADLDLLVGWLHKHNPSTPLLAVGLSAGGMKLLCYSASKICKNVGKLTCIMTISSAWDNIASHNCFQNRLNATLFGSFFKRKINRFFKKNEKLFAHLMDLDALHKSKDKSESDSHVYRVLGYKSNYDYYRASSNHEKVHDMRVPILSLTSEDDPFYPHESTPTLEASRSDRVVIVSTKRGGHMGFVDALFFKQKVGFYERVFSQYAQAMLYYGGDLKMN